MKYSEVDKSRSMKTFKYLRPGEKTQGHTNSLVNLLARSSKLSKEQDLGLRAANARPPNESTWGAVRMQGQNRPAGCQVLPIQAIIDVL